MADGTEISWSEATWNVITGCSVVSPGCRECYAMKLAGTRLRHLPSRRGLTLDTKTGPVWTGEVRFNAHWLDQPLRWTRPRMIFVVAHGDLFQEKVPQAWIDRIFAVMALCPQHVFQVLTKRSARMRDYLNDPNCRDRIDAVMNEIAPAHWHRREIEDYGGWPLKNVWAGVSVEDQERANERVPHLLATPAALRWVSAEPLLSRVDFTSIDLGLRQGVVLGEDGEPDRPETFRLVRDALRPGLDDERIDFIVVGGESGARARPMHPDWARKIRDDCAAAEVVFHFKQHGAFTAEIDRERDDPDWRADYSFRLNDREPDIEWLNLDGGRGFHGQRFHVMRRVGKKAAGFELDGRVHHDLPARVV